MGHGGEPVEGGNVMAKEKAVGGATTCREEEGSSQGSLHMWRRKWRGISLETRGNGKDSGGDGEEGLAATLPFVQCQATT